MSASAPRSALKASREGKDADARRDGGSVGRGADDHQRAPDKVHASQHNARGHSYLRSDRAGRDDVGEGDEDDAQIDGFVRDVEAAENEAAESLFFFGGSGGGAGAGAAIPGTSWWQWPSALASGARHRLCAPRSSLRSRILAALACRDRRGIRMVVCAVVGALVLTVGFYFSAALLGNDTSDDPELVSPLFAAHSRWRRVMFKTPDAGRIRNFVQQVSHQPHMSGTPEVKQVAELIRDKWRSFGIDAELEEYSVLLGGGEPTTRRLAWADGAGDGSDSFVSMHEPPIRGDGDTKNVAHSVPFHGYAASGRVANAQVVYANYGRPVDYQALAARNVNVTGRIVLVRYGKMFRGLKVRLAQRRGAAGVLIYSDPGDDGAARGKTYPRGPWRPEGSVQRGSVQFNSVCVGDPSTPGYGAVEDVPRRTYNESVAAGCLPSIPSMPLSAADALHIFKRLARAGGGGGGARDDVPDDFVGGFDRSLYRLTAPAGARLDMELRYPPYTRKSVYNVIGRIEGGGVGGGAVAHTPERQRQVIFGNHHDAWVYGAVDPHSGTAVQMEVARSLGKLLAKGWRPRRTIVLASWDGEEWGTLGSVEHVEAHAAASDLKRQAIAYVNADVVVSGRTGRIGVDGSPLLTQAVRGAMRALRDPVSGRALRDDWLARRGAADDKRAGTAATATTAAANQSHAAPTLLGLLGGGSDHTAYLHHAGVSSVDFGFDELDHAGYPVYHSVYDDFAYARRYIDHRFALHRVAAQFAGALVLDLADAPLLPMNVSDYVSWMDVQIRAAKRRWPAQLVQFENVLEPAMRELRAAGAEFARRVLQRAARTDGRNDVDAEAGKETAAAATTTSMHRLNDVVGVAFERALIDKDGLPGRSWYRHTMMAPGLDLGYGAQALPFIDDNDNDNNGSSGEDDDDDEESTARVPSGRNRTEADARVQAGIERTARALRRATAALHT